jgi:hypothetical protein
MHRTLQTTFVSRLRVGELYFLSFLFLFINYEL